MALAAKVFISYARGSSSKHARALRSALGDLAFLDTRRIKEGDRFPDELLNAILDSHVVLIFASDSYLDRKFCRLEMRLALASTRPSGQNVVVALGKGAEDVLEAMPPEIARTNWPEATATSAIVRLIEKSLSGSPSSLRAILGTESATRIAAAFIEESESPPPRPLVGMPVSLPRGGMRQSIGNRFFGRAEDLRHLHRILVDGRNAARVTSRIAAGGGFGKTLLASEYVHRFGHNYPGGVFWISATAPMLDQEFWRVLSTLDPSVPDLAFIQKSGCGVFVRLERALRDIKEPALFVVDNIPEAESGHDPKRITDYCPATGSVTVLATSRQDVLEEGVQRVSLDTLGSTSAILLLTDNLQGTSELSWAEWKQIADWVGCLPFALDLLNRMLIFRSVEPRSLLAATEGAATLILESARDALRGQVPADSLRGVAEIMQMSFEYLAEPAKAALLVLAQLGAEPIPEFVFMALPPELKTFQVRAALASRHFLVGGGGPNIGSMHRLMSDFLRVFTSNQPYHAVCGKPIAQNRELVLVAMKSLDEATGEYKAKYDQLWDACQVVSRFLNQHTIDNSSSWGRIRQILPHAETLFARAEHAESLYVLDWAPIGEAIAAFSVRQGEFDKAVKWYERVLNAKQKYLDDGSALVRPLMLSTLNNYAELLSQLGRVGEAQKLQEKLLKDATEVGEESEIMMLTINNLGETKRLQGELREAEKLFRQALALREAHSGPSHRFTLGCASNLAGTLSQLGERAEAVRIFEQVVQGQIRSLGEGHPDTLTVQAHLAGELAEAGRYAESSVLCTDIVRRGRLILPGNHPLVMRVLAIQARSLMMQGDLVGADFTVDEALSGLRAALGNDHGDILGLLDLKAQILGDRGQFAEAVRLAEDVVQSAVSKLGAHHPNVLIAKSNLGHSRLAAGDVCGALEVLKEAMQIAESLYGSGSYLVAVERVRVAHILILEDPRAAEKMITEALATLAMVLGQDHPHTINAKTALVDALLEQGRVDEAAVIQEPLVETYIRLLGKRSRHTLIATATMAMILHSQGHHNRAEKLLAFVLDQAREISGTESPLYNELLSMSLAGY